MENKSEVYCNRLEILNLHMETPSLDKLDLETTIYARRIQESNYISELIGFGSKKTSGSFIQSQLNTVTERGCNICNIFIKKCKKDYYGTPHKCAICGIIHRAGQSKHCYYCGVHVCINCTSKEWRKYRKNNQNLGHCPVFCKNCLGK